MLFNSKNRKIKKLLKKYHDGSLTREEISMAESKYCLNLKSKKDYTSDEIKEHIKFFEFKYNNFVSFLNDYKKLINITNYLLQDKNLDKVFKANYLLIKESLPDLFLFVSTSFESYMELYSEDEHININNYIYEPIIENESIAVFDIYQKSIKEDEFIKMLDNITYNIHNLIYTLQYSHKVKCKVNLLNCLFSKVCNQVLIYFYHDIANIANHRDTKKYTDAIQDKKTIKIKHQIYFQNIEFDNGILKLIFTLYKNNILRLLFETLKK